METAEKTLGLLIYQTGGWGRSGPARERQLRLLLWAARRAPPADLAGAVAAAAVGCTALLEDLTQSSTPSRAGRLAVQADDAPQQPGLCTEKHVNVAQGDVQAPENALPTCNTKTPDWDRHLYIKARRDGGVPRCTNVLSQIRTPEQGYDSMQYATFSGNSAHSLNVTVCPRYLSVTASIHTPPERR